MFKHAKPQSIVCLSVVVVTSRVIQTTVLFSLTKSDSKKEISSTVATRTWLQARLTVHPRNVQ